MMDFEEIRKRLDEAKEKGLSGKDKDIVKMIERYVGSTEAFWLRRERHYRKELKRLGEEDGNMLASY